MNIRKMNITELEAYNQALRETESIQIQNWAVEIPMDIVLMAEIKVEMERIEELLVVRRKRESELLAMSLTELNTYKRVLLAQENAQYELYTANKVADEALIDWIYQESATVDRLIAQKK